MEIRPVCENDAEELNSIYAPYVENTAVSFEYDVPTVDEFRKRIRNTLTEYPYLAAVEGGEILGYAYASAFHERAAYKHSSELSIYIKPSAHGREIGRQLYTELEEILKKQNVYRVYACIAAAENEDEFLTSDSEKFHRKMGYRTVGRHEKCGYKFGRWYDVIWMEKVLAEIPDNPLPFVPYSIIK